MIIISPENRILRDVLTKRFKSQNERIPCDIVIADFDGVTYHILTLREETNVVYVSVSIRIFEELLNFGAQDILTRIYGDLIVDPEEGYDFSLRIDLEEKKSDAAKIIKDVALLRRNIIGAPFLFVFEAVSRGEDLGDQTAKFEYRSEESIFLKPSTDKVTVVFSILFKDKDDQVFGQVFLKEFASQAKKVRNAPYVTYSKVPPQEIEEFQLKERDDVAYLSVVLFERHFDTRKRGTSVDLIPSLRDYIHYHLKCCKAYLHQRMRARVNEFYKVLNRARPQIENKEKKTMSGRTFKQQKTVKRW
ncbi:actin-related protein 2/3 complex subunit 2 [Anaeramoeba flamelloides]|uniref:Arp2/3 complex 34 kDa subunit n=1 Tax=Anaeramoeba flamelloides TaxID=1746091 RepID=A0AAV7YVG7_9EUKA|nr:actin-related protein 2/3 complex subunit [Anaeramoeba flamelloides]KAJ3433499.1 actin-related protein 2/3 complex subunit [Anaeramoeba flamelloides]KAJ3438606.1 actin-related protein 2/3 complex subunit [Anaeramoeba flamelloides]KAJ3450032.1 actin-related protein 2/3 complex subunit [Anaeramoeba flamelloides]KAJ6227363.1 actin-related protein 2/3 complex subunit 2 [Anaeramoeba flamelloides]